MPEYLIGLKCGHFWPGTGESDAHAVQVLGLFKATDDSAKCPTCGEQSDITGPVARVLSSDEAPAESR